jgi:hypothetical protein
MNAALITRILHLIWLQGVIQATGPASAEEIVI